MKATTDVARSSAAPRAGARGGWRAGRCSTAAGGQLAVGQRAADRGGAHAGLGGVLQARGQVRQHAGLAHAAAVGGGGHLDQPRLRLAGHAERLRHRQQRLDGLRAAVAGRGALAPEDHHVARVAQHVGGGGDRARLGAGAGLQPRHVDAARAERRGQRAERGLRGAGREAHRGGRVGVERAGPAGERHDPRAVAPRRLAHAQVEDRRLLHQLGLHHQHHVGVVDVAHPRGQVGPRQHARLLGVERAARAGVQVRRAERRCASGAAAGTPPRWWWRRRPAPPPWRRPCPARRRPRPARAPTTPRAARRRRAPAARSRAPASGSPGSRSGPCRTASRRPPRGCRARARAAPSSRRAR